MNGKTIIIILKPYLWRLIFTVLGGIIAVSFLVLGFGKTLLILLCCVAGYLIGMFHDKKEIHFSEKFQYWRNKW